MKTEQYEKVTPALIKWLANGERGISSNFIVAHLTGIDTGERDGRFAYPHDPDDLRRCLMLLDQVPELVPLFENMRKASPVWDRLVTAWPELVALFTAEAPHWRKGGWWRAPKTYAEMIRLAAS